MSHKSYELDYKTGGSDPLLYSHLQLTWARLGNVVKDSPDPVAQLEQDRKTVPSITFFRLAADVSKLKNPHHHGTLGSVSHDLYVSSWIHNFRDERGLTQRERQFGAIFSIMWEGLSRSFQRTHMFLGAAASLQYVESLNGIEQCQGGVTELASQNLIEWLHSGLVDRQVKAVEHLRQDAKQRFASSVAKLPTAEDMTKSHRTSNIGKNYAVNSQQIEVDINHVTSQARAFAEQQQQTLSRSDSLYLPAAHAFMAGYMQIVSGGEN